MALTNAERQARYRKRGQEARREGYRLQDTGPFGERWREGLERLPNEGEAFKSIFD